MQQCIECGSITTKSWLKWLRMDLYGFYTKGLMIQCKLEGKDKTRVLIIIVKASKVDMYAQKHKNDEC